ncbi:MAG: hypothetical protein JW834_02690 [Candidatus Diapherotrites archaeon]|nr:hypothetical protein [Candidatus Diapherotrites archaeon]
MPEEFDTMQVRTSFTPIRMMAAENQPVVMHVEVRNKSAINKNYSVTLKLPSELGFDAAFVMKEKRVRIANVEPNRAKDAVFTVFGKRRIQPGMYDMSVVVREHDERFDKSQKKEECKATLRVV